MTQDLIVWGLLAGSAGLVSILRTASGRTTARTAMTGGTAPIPRHTTPTLFRHPLTGGPHYDCPAEQDRLL